MPVKTETGMFARNVPGTTGVLCGKTIGIAGCGGLGSNAAMSLCRAGVGKMVLVDFDKVEESNLNRQCFFRHHVGMAKIFALRDVLLAINPDIGLTLHNEKIAGPDVPRVFAGCDLLIEAFDRAENKEFLIDGWCRNFRDKPILCGNGLSGLGKTAELKIRRAGNIFFCGDGTTDMSQGLCAPRVAIVANMEANLAIELLVGQGTGK